MMYFIGCIGNLMRGTGLEELLVATLGDRSPQLLGMHAVTCCDTVSYPFNKGKLTALSKLREGNFPELYSVV